ncbi:MAG: ATP-dependent zinc metalloprotease FtsH [bacterium]
MRRTETTQTIRQAFTGNFFNFLPLLLVFFIAINLFYSFSKPAQYTEEIPITQALGLIAREEVDKIEVIDGRINIDTNDGRQYFAKKGSEDFLVLLTGANIDYSKIPQGVTEKDIFPWSDILITLILPLVGFGVLFYFMAGRGVKGMLNIGRSKAKVFSTHKPKTSFKDVGGSGEVKEELSEIVDFLKNPQKYTSLGARTPKGVLMVGPSGVGKTLLARAIAGEAKVPFFSVAGSEFMEMLVGVGASRVRDLFAMAKKVSPSIVFIDEVDAIGRQRGFGVSGGHDEREQTLNQILVEMDGFDARTNVIIVAATNRPDLLDKALTRPGRFDRHITLDLPDIKEREEIIKVHMKGKPFAADVNVPGMAKRTVGYSGADIENTLNEAAILAAREGKKAISMAHLEESATKVKLGPEKKRLQSDKERRMTAFHEAGHAVVSAFLPDTDPVHRISIVSRGHTLGYTMIPPKIDRYNETKSRLLNTIAVLLGGRAAEKLEFGDITVGAANDIEQATRIARRMVTEFGMSKLGPMAFDGSGDKSWFRMQLGEYSQVSDSYASMVDRETSKIIGSSLKKAEAILKSKRKVLAKVAVTLMTKETLSQEEFEKLLS